MGLPLWTTIIYPVEAKAQDGTLLYVQRKESRSPSEITEHEGGKGSLIVKN